jgi:hypothetical protein
VAALCAEGGNEIVLEKQLGETLAGDDEAPLWHWPAR